MQKSKWMISTLLVLLILLPCFLSAQQKGRNFIVENYYKTKWGQADEFINLWKTNHYPLLKKAIEKGDIISVTAEKPKLHSGEDTRWDFKVIIDFKDSEAAFNADLVTPFKKQLYPDNDKLNKDEQYRFSLLIAHWDVMVDKIPL